MHSDLRNWRRHAHSISNPEGSDSLSGIAGRDDIGGAKPSPGQDFEHATSVREVSGHRAVHGRHLFLAKQSGGTERNARGDPGGFSGRQGQQFYWLRNRAVVSLRSPLCSRRGVIGIYNLVRPRRGARKGGWGLCGSSDGRPCHKEDRSHPSMRPSLAGWYQSLGFGRELNWPLFLLKASNKERTIGISIAIMVLQAGLRSKV